MNGEVALYNCVKNKNFEMFKILLNSVFCGVTVVNYIVKGDRLKKKGQAHSLTDAEKIAYLKPIVANCSATGNIGNIFHAILSSAIATGQKDIFLEFLSAKEFKDEEISERILNQITMTTNWIDVLQLVMKREQK